MKTQHWLKLFGISLLLVGCGGGDTPSSTQNEVKIPTTILLK